MSSPLTEMERKILDSAIHNGGKLVKNRENGKYSLIADSPLYCTTNGKLRAEIEYALEKLEKYDLIKSTSIDGSGNTTYEVTIHGYNKEPSIDEY